MSIRKWLLARKEVVILSVISVAFLVTRLTNLLLLPLFTDESIYIYWAKVIASTHAQWFISLTDGKPPLLIWMISFLLSIFPSDWYLLAGRLPSVAAGLIGCIAIYKTGELVFSKRAGIIAAALYILCPMLLFYDRMALFDSSLTAMLITSVYFAIRTGKSRRLSDGLAWGFFLGLAFLSKPTALVFLPLTVFAAFMTVPLTDGKKYAKKLSVLSLVAIVLAEIMNNLQRISSAYPAMVRKNQQFQQPLSELLSHPFALTAGNLKGFFFWTVDYYTWPLLIFGIIALLYGLRTRTQSILMLLVLWFVPLFLLATIGREIFPRYILLVVPYFLLIVAYGIDQLLSHKTFRYAGFVVIIGLSIPLMSFDYLLLTSPQKAPLPLSDANQYVLQHPSGYGLSEVYAFLRKESEKEKITVVTQGTFGLYPYAFYLEFWGNSRISILPKWPLEKLDDEILTAEKKGKVYIILKEHDEVPPMLPLQVVMKAEKPGGQYPILVTEMKEML